MSMVDIIMNMPWWYRIVLVLFSLVLRHTRNHEQKIIHGHDERLSQTHKSQFICYNSEFLFKVSLPASGFMALSSRIYFFHL